MAVRAAACPEDGPHGPPSGVSGKEKPQRHPSGGGDHRQCRRVNENRHQGFDPHDTPPPSARAHPVRRSARDRFVGRITQQDEEWSRRTRRFASSTGKEKARSGEDRAGWSLADRLGGNNPLTSECPISRRRTMFRFAWEPCRAGGTPVQLRVSRGRFRPAADAVRPSEPGSARPAGCRRRERRRA